MERFKTQFRFSSEPSGVSNFLAVFDSYVNLEINIFVGGGGYVLYYNCNFPITVLKGAFASSGLNI